MRGVLLIFSIILIGKSLFTQTASGTLVNTIVQNSPLLYNNADSGLVVANQWLSQAKKENNVMAQVRSQVMISNLYAFKTDKKSAEKKMDEVVVFARKQNEPIILQYALLSKAAHLFNIQNGKGGTEDFDEIKKLANYEKRRDLLIDYYQYMSNYHFTNFDSLMHYLHKALEESKRQKNNEKKAAVYTTIGRMLGNKKARYDEAKVYLDSARVICKKYNYQKQLSQTHYSTAVFLLKQNSYNESLGHLKESQSIQLQLNDQAIIASKTTLANVLLKLDRSMEALDHYRQCIVLCSKYDAKSRLPVIYQNIGSLFMESKQIDSAKYYLQKAIAISKELNDRHALAFATYNFAEIQRDEENYKDAKSGMTAALNIFEDLQETSNVAWVLPRIVELELGQYEKGKNNSTTIAHRDMKSMLDRSMALNANGNNYETLENIYDCYSKLGKLTGDLKMTTEYQSKLLVMKDTIFNQEKLKANIEMAAKLKDAEQKTTIAQLEIKNNKTAHQKNLAYFFLGFSLLSGVGIYFSYINKTQRRHEISLLKQKEEFRNQVSSDLHDDVGTLLTGVALQSEVASMSADLNLKKSLIEISTMSRAAMEQMRDIVWTLDSRKDKYENLVDRMRAFAEQQLHLKNINHKFEFELTDGGRSIPPNVRQNVYLIFKEAITNIVKHSNADFANIRFKQSDNRSELMINDNGSIVPSINTDGAGLSNMKKRAESIGGVLNITTDNGFSISLIF